MATATISQIVADVQRRFPEVTNVGIENCRRIENDPDKDWSQHAWGNAADFIVGNNQALGNRIYYHLLASKVRLSVGTICWKSFGGCNPETHQDHLHVEGYPKQTGTPACAGGQTVKTSTGAGPGMEGEGGLLDTLGAIGALFTVEPWLRVLWFIGGVAFVGIGMSAILKEFNVNINPLDALPVGKVVKAIT